MDTKDGSHTDVARSRYCGLVVRNNGVSTRPADLLAVPGVLLRPAGQDQDAHAFLWRRQQPRRLSAHGPGQGAAARALQTAGRGGVVLGPTHTRFVHLKQPAQG